MNTKKIVLFVGLGALILIILLGFGQLKGLDCSLKISESMKGEWINGIWTEGLWIAPPLGASVFHPGVATPHYIEWCEPLAFALMPFFPLLLLSLITYRMKYEVFHAWWRFARWWVPVIMIVTFLLENAGGGGTLGMNKDFTALILIVLYSALIVTSLVKIFNAYLKTKGE